jgi:hypothetical protein
MFLHRPLIFLVRCSSIWQRLVHAALETSFALTAVLSFFFTSAVSRFKSRRVLCIATCRRSVTHVVPLASGPCAGVPLSLYAVRLHPQGIAILKAAALTAFTLFRTISVVTSLPCIRSGPCSWCPAVPSGPDERRAVAQAEWRCLTLPVPGYFIQCLCAADWLTRVRGAQ